jgi:hypothetical protein
MPIAARQRRPNNTHAIHLKTKGAKIAKSRSIRQNMGLRSIKAKMP